MSILTRAILNLRSVMQKIEQWWAYHFETDHKKKNKFSFFLVNSESEGNYCKMWSFPRNAWMWEEPKFHFDSDVLPGSVSCTEGNRCLTLSEKSRRWLEEKWV